FPRVPTEVFICSSNRRAWALLAVPSRRSSDLQMFAERLRYVVVACEVRHEQHRIRFTISLGVADLSVPSNGHAQLIEWADSALYASKSAGRNRVTLHQL